MGKQTLWRALSNEPWRQLRCVENADEVFRIAQGALQEYRARQEQRAHA